MKTQGYCFDCAQADPGGPDPILWAELLDDGLLWFECERGDSTAAVLQEHKFEVLFEFGAMALVDGYYREAVSSFAAALERFYESYARVVCKGQGADAEQFAQAWKPVAAQSERQLGAFLFTHLLETKQPCKWLEGESVQLRNSVIHKGYLPTRAEALGYGERALSFMIPLLRYLRAKYRTEMESVAIQQVAMVTERARQRNPLNLGVMTIPTVTDHRSADGAVQPSSPERAFGRGGGSAFSLWHLLLPGRF